MATLSHCIATSACLHHVQDAGDDEDEPITDAIGATKGLAVDNGDDALLLLRALAAQDPDVRDKLKGQSEILGTRCTVM